MIVKRLERIDLLRLVRSTVPCNMEVCDQLTHELYEGVSKMKWTGDQYNPSWIWNEDYLAKLYEFELWDLYTQYRFDALKYQYPDYE